jgi:hypothetical protein
MSCLTQSNIFVILLNFMLIFQNKTCITAIHVLFLFKVPFIYIKKIVFSTVILTKNGIYNSKLLVVSNWHDVCIIYKIICIIKKFCTARRGKKKRAKKRC